MSATAFLFPGLNSMRRPQDFLPLLRLPGFTARWREVRAVFGDLPDFAAFDRALHAGDGCTLQRLEQLHLLALASATAQAATAEALVERGVAANWVCGYSIGDVARTLHAGGASFADLVRFARALPLPLPGARSADGRTIMAVAPSDRLAARTGRILIGSSPLTICPLSPRVTMLAGSADVIGHVASRLQAASWRCRTILGCALHSLLRAPLAAVLQQALAPVELQRPRTRVFSSIHRRELTGSPELRRELVANVAVTYDFAGAVRALHRVHGVTRFVDVGPGHVVSSLLGQFDPPLPAECALDLLNDGRPRATG